MCIICNKTVCGHGDFLYVYNYMCLLQDLHFTLLYDVVSQQFDKRLYLTSCLNACNHNTCIRLPQTGSTARKLAPFIISQDRQTQVLAANAMATIIIID